jgi:hypothetical protein
MGDIYSSSRQSTTNKAKSLPRVTKKQPEYVGTLSVLESFDHKSEVNQSDYTTEFTPDRPFTEMIEAINKDPRLDMSRETYAQMIMGSGLKIKISKRSTQDLVNEWLSEIRFEEMLEDGLYSYVGVGNLLWEKAPKNADFVEIPIDTIKSIIRDKKGNIKSYIQYVNNKEIAIPAKDVIHFKLSNVSREIWGRGIFHSILSDYEDPRSGKTYDSPLIQMKEIEDSMAEIFHSYASPLLMFQFEDAGEDFIRQQADALKKAKPGMKIVTDKPFKVEKFEVNGNAKFDGYVEHLQKDVIEPGSKFPLQFFNAGFTARAASESTDSVLIRKVKRIQKRLGLQIRDEVIIPFLRGIGNKTKAEDITIVFEFESKAEMTVPDAVTLYRDNGIKRSELRQYLLKTTALDIDQTDMSDLPPITSVTPTNKLTSDKTNDNNVVERAMQDLKNMVSLREELDRADKRKKTDEIINFIKGLKE